MKKGLENRNALVLVLTTVLGLLACVSRMASPTIRITPQQGWCDDRGPVVPHDKFPTDCSLCHVGDGWHDIIADFEFDHEAETGVPLEGAHAEAECLRCHNDRGPVERFALRGCSGCHEDVHRGQLGKDCSSCHDESSWQPKEEIALHDRTRFPLVGSHAAAACWRCHPGAAVGTFAPVDTSCESCHADDLVRATIPDHQALGYTDSCERCHNPTTWRGASFSHEFFPLTGAHSAASCQQCHTGGVFEGTPQDCYSCHLGDYNGAPDHVSGGFPTSCQECHGTTTWDGANFDHSFYPLTGAHDAASCQSCHEGGIFAGTPQDCYSCHLSDYNGAPDHQAGNFSHACEDCHTTVTWEGAGIDHSFFPLTGAHATTTCESCHVGGVFQGTPNDCYSCHLSDFNGAPNHLSGGFSHACEDCHSTSTWEGADFDHSTFPLTGAHSTVTCEACHVGGVFQGTPQDCYSCHLSDYNGAPNHLSGNFSHTCEDCHSTSTWDGADFDHSTFPLTGAHSTASCAECHVGGVFGGTPRDCMGCHAAEYNGAPGHVSSGFPTTCQDCHSTNTWGNADFDHDQFFRLRGPHRTMDCTSCHLTPGNYASFSCIDCHEHSRSRTDNEHDDVNGYVYASSACVSCHD